MSDAQMLRETAALIRERAQAATPGPWAENVLGSEGYDIRGAEVPVYPSSRINLRPRLARCGYQDWDTDKANAEHIASWHPAVALAVAGWLDRVARIAPPDPHQEGDRCETCENVAAALAVARAYLGRTA